MTSRTKIACIRKTTKHTSCAVVLKTGAPPGVMVAETDTEAEIKAWVGGVKRLRYKDFRLLRLERVMEDDGGSRRRLAGVELGAVKEIESMKEMSSYMAECGLLPWWTEGMGFIRGGV
ncbi:MAG: hypothetical protein Q9219_003452 [cf. Caloplaca sp. 3 TL-2023]